MKTIKTYWFFYIILIILVLFSFTSCSSDDSSPYQDCVEFNAWVDSEVAKLRSYDKWNLTTQKEIKRLLDLKQECTK
jgi:hypothetical protein